MNRKQRRIAQSQATQQESIRFRGRSYTFEDAYSLAIERHNASDFEAAIEVYNRMLIQVPDSAEIYNNRGVALYDIRFYADALTSFDKAISLKPGYGDAHYNRANALQKIERFNDALVNYDNAIQLNPGNAGAYSNRGITLHSLHRYDEALASYDKAIQLNPGNASAHISRGNVLHDMNRFDDALVSYDKAIQLNPGNASAHISRGKVLHDMNRFNDALVSYDKAIQLNPGNADGYSKQGITLNRIRRYDEALANYDKSISLDPDNADTYYSRGFTLYRMQRYERALVDFRQADTLNPSMPYLSGILLLTCLHLCQWEELDQRLAKLGNDIETGKPVAAPFNLVATPLSAATQKQCAETYTRNKCPLRQCALWNGERYSHDRIRIGYLSADFYNHATAYLAAGLFERHDRSSFEVIGFSFGPPYADAMRKRLEKAFDRFMDVNTKTDLEIATIVRGLEIDIAVDLKGFTGDSRTGIFAMRPAPVQVNYLGYPGTMGASYMDYLIADHVLIPEGQKHCFSEKIAYLPHSYQVNDSTRQIAERAFTRSECGLPENAFVFCCFNRSYKIMPQIFEIWLRLVQKVPGSVLWLFADNPSATKTLRSEAHARGVAGDRLVFADQMDLANHLARLQLADLFLDTLPCNAHTTASDALWAGVPVVTCLGETLAGRVAASLLTAIGLPELIARSHEEYEAMAVEMATDPGKRSAIRQKLKQNRLTGPLFNTALSTRHIEAAYKQMWEKNRRGLKPDHIDVAA